MGEGILVDNFSRVDGALHCEGVSAAAIAESVGTPTYVYSATAIREQYQRLSDVLSPVPHRIHYSVKANSSGAILRLLHDLGAGVDIVSGGELFRVRRAGFVGEDIVFSGVGKTAQELREALQAGVLMVNVESEGELRLLDRIAWDLGVVAPFALRVNPEVTVDTPHPYTRTGERGMKFGIPYDEALAVGRVANALRNVRHVGWDMHIGSQVAGVEPYREGARRLLQLHDQLQTEDARNVRYLDAGGGLAVTYAGEAPIDLNAFAGAILPEVTAAGLTLLVEPGRFLVGNAGMLLTRVLYRKRSGGREYVIIDAGMTDLLRPSHYNAYHRIEAVQAHAHKATFDIVGPVCESGDFFALDRELDDVVEGDLLAVCSAGAYGFVMASNYNSRPRPAEILVDGDRYAVATRRESYEDLVRHELRALEWRRS